MVFRIGITRDLLKDSGEPAYPDIGLGLVADAPDVEAVFLEETTAVLSPEAIASFDALVVSAPRLPRETIEQSPQLRIVARMGVGFDTVDVDACTERGIPVTITPDASRTPVASAALALLLSLTHNLTRLDRIVRADRWAERTQFLGTGLRDRTLSLIGMGNIGSEFLRLTAPLGMRRLVHDPYADPAAVEASGATPTGLDEAVAQADFLVIMCRLTPETHHLLDQARIETMKSSAFVINVARGQIIDQAALTSALSSGRLGGAGLDVFETEPLPASDPLVGLDNVILGPHALSLTDQWAQSAGTSALSGILDLHAGRRPAHVVNPEALATDRNGE